MKKITFTLFIAFVLLIIGGSFAKAGSLYGLGIEDDDAIVVTWRTSNNNWKACGPVQRTSTSWKTERKAKKLVTGNEDFVNLYYVGSIGKYSVYSLGRKLRSQDYNARRCLD